MKNQLERIATLKVADAESELKKLYKEYSNWDGYKSKETAEVIKNTWSILSDILKNLKKLETTVFNKGSEFLMPTVNKNIKQVLQQYITEEFNPKIPKAKKLTPEEKEMIKKKK